MLAGVDVGHVLCLFDPKKANRVLESHLASATKYISWRQLAEIYLFSTLSFYRGMDNERIPENERLQIEQIRDLETEVLQVEEVDDHSSGDNSE